MTSSSFIISIPEAPLGSSGKSLPVVGFGTAAESLFASLADSSEKKAILDAIRIGYRHFDSAAVYQSEEPLGQAIKEALALGLVNSRDELFITTKLWCSDAHRDCVLPALQKSLKTLELEYVDLYLIHWPVSVKPGKHGYPVNKKDVVPIDIQSVWEAMEECQKLGLAKSIGVSNFSSKKLEALLTTAKIPPSVNQVEMNPVWQQKKLREFCKEKGILITAYSPLGAKGTAWGTNLVMDNELLKQIANEKGKTVAQVSLRWLYEQGVSFVVKSFNKERMKENLDVFGWNLSPADCQKISQIPQHKVNLGQEFISEDGPYKSLEDLWDDEI